MRRGGSRLVRCKWLYTGFNCGCCTQLFRRRFLRKVTTAPASALRPVIPLILHRMSGYDVRCEERAHLACASASQTSFASAREWASGKKATALRVFLCMKYSCNSWRRDLPLNTPLRAFCQESALQVESCKSWVWNIQIATIEINFFGKEMVYF